MSDQVLQDQRTTELCLGEVARCTARSAGPAFLLLSGERYGWRALPSRVPKDEMGQLLAHIIAPADSCVKAWYRVDDNSALSEYVLRPIKEVEKDPNTPEGLRSFWGDKENKIDGAQDLLLAAFRAAVKGADLPSHRRDEYNISVTHKEYRAVAPSSVTAVVRTLQDLQKEAGVIRAQQQGAGTQVTTGAPPTEAERYAAAVNTYFAPDVDVDFLEGLRGEAKQVQPPCGMSYDLPWRIRAAVALGAADPELAHAAYLRRMSANLYAHLAAGATAAANAPRVLLEPVDHEAASHALMAAERARTFQGRKDLRAKAAALLTPKQLESLAGLIYGASGTGKVRAPRCWVVEGSRLG